jgi:hypothetical protein
LVHSGLLSVGELLVLSAMAIHVSPLAVTTSSTT